MNIEWYEPFFRSIDPTGNLNWISRFHKELSELFTKPAHGNFSKWKNTVKLLSAVQTELYDFTDSTIQIGSREQLTENQVSEFTSALKSLQPWRKGPFNFFGINIDSEWRSDQKWNRLQAHLPTLEDKSILDIGCGNGYYMLRMLGAGANNVVGLDPSLLFLAQFWSMIRCINTPLPAHLLPIGLEQLPPQFDHFDLVVSMGVLYHRRNPLEHINQLFHVTASGGTVYLETLIVEESYSDELIPAGRYAGMRNVWSVPSPARVLTWLTEAGFVDGCVLNKTFTSVDEQRSTEWMQNFSLREFLNPHDPSKTIEGYPAPLRAIFSARKSQA